MDTQTSTDVALVCPQSNEEVKYQRTDNHEHKCSCMPEGRSIRNYKRFTDPKDYLEELKNQGMINTPANSEADQAEPTAAASAPADPPANKAVRLYGIRVPFVCLTYMPTRVQIGKRVV